MAGKKKPATGSKDELPVSTDDGFIFIALKKDALERYDLPEQPCPVRLSTFTSSFSTEALDYAVLADECAAYSVCYPAKQAELKTLLAGLCYAAGVLAGKDGDDAKAQQYLARACETEPGHLPAAANYALSLRKAGCIDEALDIYEQVISTLQNGELGFSPEIWEHAARTHYMKGNLSRVLELLEYGMKEAPQYFGDSTRDFIRELRTRLA